MKNFHIKSFSKLVDGTKKQKPRKKELGIGNIIARNKECKARDFGDSAREKLYLPQSY